MAFFLTIGGAASACSLVTSWDDVKLGSIAQSDAGKVDASPTDSGAVDANVPNDSGPGDSGSTDSCVPGTVVCMASTSGTSNAALYACNDAGTYDPPVTCLHECVLGGADGTNDYCSCNPGDTYCGGDNVVGDPKSLYQCGVNAPPTFKEKCSISCVVHPGMNDQCNL